MTKFCSDLLTEHSGDLLYKAHKKRVVIGQNKRHGCYYSYGAKSYIYP